MRKLVVSLVILSLIGALWWLRKEMQAIAAEPITAWSEDHKGDCAVVLTGGAGRVREGFDLLAQGQVRKLIISGVNQHSTLRDIFPQLPFYGDLRPEDVILERRSTTTYGNAVQSLPLVEALRCRRVVLVTSHLHMRRAYRTFQGSFPTDVMLTTRSISSGSVPPRTWDVFTEALKSIFYSLWAY